jgi:uncharacterized membrane protein
MSLIELGMLPSILLVTLVAGIILTFAVVVTPGIKPLNDHDFLQAFKAMDRVIQRYHPVFMSVWIGSIVAVAATSGLSLFMLEGIDRVLLVTASAIYILGVMLPTATINVPLNNELQKHYLTEMSEAELRAFRHKFEQTWNSWNILRTVVAVIAAVLLLVVVIRI